MAPSSTTHSATNYVEATRIQKDKAFETPTSSQIEMATAVDIIDIRHDVVEISLKDEIVRSLKPQNGLKRLPTLLLYDERGLQLFEEVGPRPKTGLVLLTAKRSHIWKNIISPTPRLRSFEILLVYSQMLSLLDRWLLS